MSGDLDYGNIMNRAMRGFIKEVLQRVADNGLPGEHHFFITLETMHPDVEIADWLVTRYPEEITIVMQHWFENLVVQEDGFSVTLSFGDEPEALYIPYASIITFVDPSVEFGVRFEKTNEEHVDEDLDLQETPERPLEVLGLNEPELKKPNSDTQKADVVSLDSFRK